MKIKTRSLRKLISPLKIGQSAIVVARNGTAVSSVLSRLQPAAYEQQAVMIVAQGDTECLRGWIVTRKQPTEEKVTQ